MGIWGRNIADEFYLTNAVDVQGFGFDYRHVGTPRMFGVDAHYHYQRPNGLKVTCLRSVGHPA